MPSQIRFSGICLLQYSRSVFGRNAVYRADRFNCSINDLIYGRLPIIINSYVCNSVDETTLDRVAFMGELIMIRDSSLTLSGLLSSDGLNDVFRTFARAIVGFSVCLFSYCILYLVYDIIINNNKIMIVAFRWNSTHNNQIKQ